MFYCRQFRKCEVNNGAVDESKAAVVVEASAFKIFNIKTSYGTFGTFTVTANFF